MYYTYDVEINQLLIRNYKDYVSIWKKYRNQTPFNVTLREIRCKYCDSRRIIKYGRLKNKQCWWCKECQRKFTDSKPLRGMKVSFEAMRTALRLFFKGIPLRTIRMQLEDEYNLSPTPATIIKWMQRVTHEILEVDRGVHPEVGDTWMIFETPLTISQKQYWILDVLDTRSLFLLVSQLSHQRRRNDFRALLESAKEKGSGIPVKILNYSSMKYPENLELIFGEDIQLISVKSGKIKIPGDWSRPFKERIAVLQGHKEGLVHTILDGWRIQYNHYRSHQALEGQTPGQRAGVSFPYSHGYLESTI
jgi:transposase-like protein